jgi:hypothetical protein
MEPIIMSPRVFAVVCAWCNRVVTTAPAGSSVTHTICASCLDWTFSPTRDTSIDPGADGGPFRLPDRYFGFGEDR